MSEVRQIRRLAGVTQSRLAALAGTSQPTIAAYESGTKSPNLRTLRRLARAVGLEARIEFVRAMTREDRRSLALHEAIAQKLAQEPETTLRQARTTLDLMLKTHPGAAPLLNEWDEILRRPVPEITDILLDPNSKGRELRRVAPFAGVLSARERAQVYRHFAESERASS